MSCSEIVGKVSGCVVLVSQLIQVFIIFTSLFLLGYAVYLKQDGYLECKWLQKKHLKV